MESTGKAGAIQVTEETCQILQMFGYTFEQRGLVAVKGKGQLMTYYLMGKSDKPPTSPQILMKEKNGLEDIKNSPKLQAPGSPNPQTLSSATASPSSVRLNQNYQPSNLDTDNLESLESNCEESIDDKNSSTKHNENDPLLSASPKPNVALNNNHIVSDEKAALLNDAS